MRYIYNEAGGVVNGVIFYFEMGDKEIALQTFKILVASAELPTSIVWRGVCMTPSDVLFNLVRTKDIGRGFLGVRFTTSESKLLKRYLVFLRATYPALTPLTREIDSRVFGTVQ